MPGSEILGAVEIAKNNLLLWRLVRWHGAEEVSCSNRFEKVLCKTVALSMFGLVIVEEDPLKGVDVLNQVGGCACESVPHLEGQSTSLDWGEGGE